MATKKGLFKGMGAGNTSRVAVRDAVTIEDVLLAAGKINARVRRINKEAAYAKRLADAKAKITLAPVKFGK